MYHEIERKFLIRKMPKLSGIVPELQERYFLQHGDLEEERIQKKDDVYEYEFKVAVSPREWRREKRNISESEFKQLIARAPKVLLRESYSLSKKNPRMSIKKYKGDYRGLVFVEVEFDSLKESEAFEPLEWMGTEITNSSLGREARLLSFDREHFLSMLSTEMDTLKTDFSPEGL